MLERHRQLAERYSIMMLPFLPAFSVSLLRMWVDSIPSPKVTVGGAALLYLLLGVPAAATPIYPEDRATSPDSTSLEERRRYTMQLMQAAPFPTDYPVSARELTNPLDMDGEIVLQTFGRLIYNIDLLASPMIPDPDLADIELPPGALRGIDILEDLDSLYLSYGGRAFDKTVLDVSHAEITEQKGLPITTDASPLTMGGFGEITRAR